MLVQRTPPVPTVNFGADLLNSLASPMSSRWKVGQYHDPDLSMTVSSLTPKSLHSVIPVLGSCPGDNAHECRRDGQIDMRSGLLLDDLVSSGLSLNRVFPMADRTARTIVDIVHP